MGKILLRPNDQRGHKFKSAIIRHDQDTHRLLCLQTKLFAPSTYP